MRGLLLYESYTTYKTEKCPSSLLTGVRIRRVIFRENIWTFCRDTRDCLLYPGVRIKRVSVERGSTVTFQLFLDMCVRIVKDELIFFIFI